MDHTLLGENSARLFTSYRRKTGQISTLTHLRFGYWLLKYAVGIVDAEHMAREALKDYANTSEEALRRECDQWFEKDVLPYLNEEGVRQVRMHQERGDEVAIVTSSTRYGTAPLGKVLDIDDLLCTELEVRDGQLTGELIAPISFGTGKVLLAKRYLAERDLGFSDAVFYSDSITDLPLLEAVGHRVVVNPDLRLKRIAKTREWPICYWNRNQMTGKKRTK